ncbi:MAG: GNAT family N-acetyltransferase [Candidatus Aminicenantes bacterium]|nr:GNAT family N-acetyltransferase [Candidatus Aminicenantes bacterium]
MKKKENLKDGTEITIRKLALSDLDRLMEFYSELPENDKKYFRVDVTKRDVVEQRIKQTRQGNFFRLVALYNDKIIADGNLELSAEQWRKDQGELRVIAAKNFQHKGLGTIMLRELYYLAAQNNVKNVIVRIMRPQKAARAICHKLGLREETVIPDYVRDISGKKQDMIVMTGDMKEFWEELEHFYEASDWRHHR